MLEEPSTVDPHRTSLRRTVISNKVPMYVFDDQTLYPVMYILTQDDPTQYQMAGQNFVLKVVKTDTGKFKTIYKDTEEAKQIVNAMGLTPKVYNDYPIIFKIVSDSKMNIWDFKCRDKEFRSKFAETENDELPAFKYIRLRRRFDRKYTIVLYACCEVLHSTC